MGIAFLLLAGLLWSTGGAGIKTLSGFPPLAVSGGRSAISAAFFFFLLKGRVMPPRGSGVWPWAGAADSPLARVAREAYAEAWGTDVVDVGLGGSIPLVADLLEVFPEATVLVTGVEDPDSRAHSENESVHLGELERAALAEALLLARLG